MNTGSLPQAKPLAQSVHSDAWAIKYISSTIHQASLFDFRENETSCGLCLAPWVTKQSRIRSESYQLKSTARAGP